MTAATADRNTPRKLGNDFGYPAKGGALVHMGTLVVMAAGLAQPGFTGTGLFCAGVAKETVDNTAGADGAVTVPVIRGELFRFSNSAAADAITLADVGHDAYIVDDSTVAKTDGGGARSIAGKIRDVDAYGVWIYV